MMLSSMLCAAQIKNAKTETVKIYGNCGMCEKTIEKAGNLKRVASVDWDKDTQMAVITYDAKKTNQAEILKRIALAGYDSDSFLAPDDVYANLHGCCQYDRVKKSESVADVPFTELVDHEVNQDVDQMTPVFNYYFDLKDALVRTNGATAADKSKALLSAINNVKMDKISMKEHKVWMNVLKDLQEDATQISSTKDVEKQRKSFISLSRNMYELMKASKTVNPVYYQHCPMADGGKGANWLSKEKEIKNPYYGSKMMSCGKVVETIK